MAFENDDQRQQFVAERGAGEKEHQIEAGAVSGSVQDRFRIANRLQFLSGVIERTCVTDIGGAKRVKDRFGDDLASSRFGERIIAPDR
jgi:hypothetical protein